MSRHVVKQQVVGQQVRYLRTRRGLSVRALATRGGFSPSFISQVELGQASPSIDSLQRIADVLDVTLSEFFATAGADAPKSPIVRRPERKVLQSGWSKATIQALSTAPAPMEALLVVLAPGGRSGKLAHGHTTDRFAFLIRGQAVLSLGALDYVLGPGDSVMIQAGTPALWRNDGKRSAQVLVVSVRPSAHRGLRPRARRVR